MIILLTGGSGKVGTIIKQDLVQKGFTIRNLSRKPSKKNDFKWDIEKGYIDPKALHNVDGIIHLAGAGIIDKPWTESYKKVIYNSRIKSTKLLFKEIQKQEKRPKTLVSTSAIGYYTEPAFDVDENAKKGNDFMAKVCADWEKEALKFKELGMNVSIIRTGIVLQKEGGFFPIANKTAFLNIFPTVGDPKNFISWIHVKDLSALYLHLLTNNKNEITNGCTPKPCTQLEFMKALAKVQNKSGFHPNVPSFLIKVAMGQRSEAALSNKKVLPKNTLNTGFTFAYESLSEALKDLTKA